ncbi:MAG: ATP phosphoribosyltransferase regulatory subunit [Okeania sp. SIO2C9]|uniref:ATP phosphoribosyltransferase regulatory subunit n=1 Tax=Okeania sp. SIO2C9 TaxID=2607791 RepID=UPI0013C21C22|nr:ATP phosphoribosyltransferase regulatory subunit [Okeania sp. SIO2C9]NEQ72756.1 ATP phosphoribosyltransferase regulatory subunit [Okeania sp. SIO2C9]
MQTTKVERVRGVRDILPNTYHIDKQIKNALSGSFESYGYRPIDVPLIEYTELYLKKSGEDIVSRLYDFIYRNRRLCLRPEFTASVVRAYLDNFQEIPLPVRLYYTGPVFRYEKPQKERYRQFTQMGIELIGAKGAIADAEVISMACQGLDSLGLTEYQMFIGHVGVINKFLDHLELDTRLRSFLLTQMETLRKEGRQTVENLLSEIYPAFQKNASVQQQPGKNITTKKITDLLQNLEEEEARTAIFEFIESMNIELSSTREPEEIVDRLLVKIKHQNQTKQLNQALDFMTELSQLKGEPNAILKETEKLLLAYSIDDYGLKQLQDILQSLDAFNVDKNRISIDLGISRGLQYYTGMVFEISDSNLGERKLCGGGRYDDLVVSLGGQQETPATGFSYVMEELREVLAEKSHLNINNYQFVEAFVVGISSDDYVYTVEIAEKLRKLGLRIETDIIGRNIENNIEYAIQHNIPFLIILNSVEQQDSKVLLQNLESGEKQNLELNEVVKKVRNT